MKNNSRTLIGGAATIAVAIGMTAGIGTASAAPQHSPGTFLDVPDDPANSANSIVTIRGVFPMSEGSAYDILRNIGPGGGMHYLIYADDPGENDGMIGSPHPYVGSPGPTGGLVIATPKGISYMREISVPRSDLNEDDGSDELYASARFVPDHGGPGELRAFTTSYSWSF